MMRHVISRRGFIKRGLLRPGIVMGMAGFTLLTANACNRNPGGSADAGEDAPAPGSAKAPGGNPCEDLSGVSQQELQKRESFGYVRESPISDKQCQNCNLWLPPGGSHQCGACTLFKGPVLSGAYCTYWAPQV